MKNPKKVTFLTVCLGLIFLGTAGFALDLCVTDSPYNATPDDSTDDSAAFYQALTNIVFNGGGTLTVPAGTYKFSSRERIDLANKTVAISGKGKGVSRLASTNADGIWWFDNTSNSNKLSISNLTFVAANGGNSGTALQINHNSLCPDDSVCNLLMEHVGFDVDSSGTDYFAKHIYTSYLQSPVFIDVLIEGSKSSESGFRINYGNHAYFNNCYCWSAEKGFSLLNYKGDVIFDRCNAVGDAVGVEVVALSSENCTVDLLQLHLNNTTNNIRVKNADEVNIINVASYVKAIVTPFTDIIIDNCAQVVIRAGAFHQPYNPNRTNIYLKGATSGVIIKQNIFNTCGGWRPGDDMAPEYLEAAGPYLDSNGAFSNLVVHLVQDASVSDVTSIENIDTPHFDQ